MRLWALFFAPLFSLAAATLPRVIHFEPTREGGAFLARGPGYGMRVDGGGMDIRVLDPAQRGTLQSDRETVTRLRWIGARTPRGARGLDPLTSVSHELLGDDRSAWRTNIPHYARVRFTEIYPGVDVVYYTGSDGLEYDFVLAPGADPARIRIGLDVAGTFEIDPHGDLVLRSAGREFRQRKPRVYQLRDGRQVEIAGRYRHSGDRQVGFELGSYDRSRPLVIDPVVLWNTLLGGVNGEGLAAVATDAEGNVYVAGSTGSPNMPLQGALQTAFAGAPADAYVAKLSPDGRRLIYATFIGTSGRDNGTGIVVDEAGNAIVAGVTASAAFPTTAGAAQRTFGGNTDAFLLQLDPTGSRIVFSTFLGGAAEDSARRMARDAQGDFYLVGTTNGAFPTTASAFQRNPGGAQDGFLAKISRRGDRIVYATLFGGTGSDNLYDVDVLPTGEAAVGGSSGSSGLPTNADSYQRNLAGSIDGLVAVFDPTGSRLLYITYLGGTGFDEVYGLSLDNQGNLRAVGGTDSRNLPVTTNAQNRTYIGGASDGFAARIPLPPAIPRNPAALGGGNALPRAANEPLSVGYIGDDQQNNGLDVIVIQDPLGRRIFISLSNFTMQTFQCGSVTTTGTFGRILEWIDEVIQQVVCIPGADGSNLAAGVNAVVAAGFALPNAPRANGFQPAFAGGTSDGYATAVGDPAFLEITKTFVGKDGQPTDRGNFESGGKFVIQIRNKGTETARGVQIHDTAGLNLTLRAANGGTVPCPTVTASSVMCGPVDIGTTPVVITIDADFPAQGLSRNDVVAAGTNSNIARARKEVTVDRGVTITKRLVETITKPNVSGPFGIFEIVVANVRGKDIEDFSLSDSPIGLRLETVLSQSADAGIGPCFITARSGIAVSFMTCKGTLLSAKSLTVRFEAALTAGWINTAIASEGAVEIARARVADTQQPERPTSTTCTVVCRSGSGAAAPGFDPPRSSTPARAARSSEASGACAVPTGDVPAIGSNQASMLLGTTSFSCVLPSTAPATITGLSTNYSVPVSNSAGAPGVMPQLDFTSAAGQATRAPGTLATDGRTVRFTGTSIPVVNGRVSFDVSNVRLDTRSIPDNPNAREEVTLITNFTVGTEPHTQTSRLEVEKSPEVFPSVREFTSANGGGWKTTIFEGFKGAFEEDTRLNIAFENLGNDWAFTPMPECLPVLGDFQAQWRRVVDADALGRGGLPVTNCGTFMPAVTPDSTGARTGRATFQLFGRTASDGLIGFDATFGGFVFTGQMPTGVRLRAGLGPYLATGELSSALHGPAYNQPASIAIASAPAALTISEGGLGGAAFGPAAIGGLASLFGVFGGTVEQAVSVPLPEVIQAVQVIVFPVAPTGTGGRTAESQVTRPLSAGFIAPLLFVSPGQINLQIPWELDIASGFVDAIVVRGGVPSDVRRLAVAARAPAIFTAGATRAIAINPDGSLSQPAGVFGGGTPSRPVATGEVMVVLATGLGVTNPPSITGDDSIDANGNFVRRDTALPVKVTIGGIEQTVAFAGMSPQFPGVNQLNLIVAAGTPAGDAIPLVLEIGGARSRADVTVAVRAN